MIDSIRSVTISAYLTLFAATPDLDFLQLPYEKIGFGVLLFFIIWTYMRTVLPKTQAILEEKNKRIEDLINVITKLTDQRDEDQRMIDDLVRRSADNKTQKED